MADINIKIVIPEKADAKVKALITAIRRILGFAHARLKEVEGK